MKISRIITYLFIAMAFATYAVQSTTEEATLTSVPRDVLINDIICENLDKKNMVKSITEIWKLRETSKLFKEIITDENIYKCLMQRRENAFVGWLVLDLVCKPLQKGNLFESIWKIWKQRGKLRIFDRYITPQWIAYCIRRYKLEYTDNGNPIIMRAVEEYKNEYGFDNFPLGVFNILIDGGFDVNAKNNYGYTALHVAVTRNYKEVVKRLLKSNANINLQSDIGWTPLISLIRHLEPIGIKFKYIPHDMGDPADMVKLLIDNGADISLRDRILGRTALDWAKGIYRSYNRYLPEAAKIKLLDCIQILEKAEKQQEAKKNKSTSSRWWFFGGL